MGPKRFADEPAKYGLFYISSSFDVSSNWFYYFLKINKYNNMNKKINI